MSSFDTNKNPAICVLPWVHEYRQIDGGVAPCCRAGKLKDENEMQSIRTAMLEGKKPSICDVCYKNEENTSWSYRILETKDWLNKFGEPNVNVPELQYLDVRFDPTCNLKCKTCGPEFSTLWQKEKNLKIEKNQINEKYIESVDKGKLKKVYLAGGEPMYIKNYLTFLEGLHEVNPDCEIIVNTNLKSLPSRWKVLLPKFKNLSVICSCDAIETLGTYVRYPLEWKQFEENVKFISDNVNFLQFNLVASNLTTHTLYETCSWMSKYSSNINMFAIRRPDIFSEKSVPPNKRQIYIESIKKLDKFPVSVRYVNRFRSQVAELLDRYEKTPYEYNTHIKLTKEIEDQDKKRNLSLHDVDPFLANWIHE